MVKERYEKATLLQVEIKTGRTHQIRIHMESVGHPLVGDKLYGDVKALPFKRQALHAEFLEFRHPITNLKIKIQAPLPKDIQDLIENLREGV
jgi:23S rRNA pseudouridine1911/1915/1917 synthase